MKHLYAVVSVLLLTFFAGSFLLRNFRIYPALVEFRTNGFVSRRAGGKEGILTTYPLRLEGTKLSLNAEVRGTLAVEALDEAGQPIIGYTRDGCLLGPFDSTQQQVSWRDGKDLSALKGKNIRLRFYSRNADLYGFQVQ